MVIPVGGGEMKCDFTSEKCHKMMTTMMVSLLDGRANTAVSSYGANPGEGWGGVRFIVRGKGAGPGLG